MSVRAHRVKEIFFDGESFNLWHDQEIVDYLENNGLLEQLNTDMSGFIEISVEDIENMLNIVRDDNVRDSLRKDLEWAKGQEKDYLLYYCF